MPRLKIDYSKTLIYKIVCNDLEVTDLYVGSTSNFTKRKNSHKNRCCNKIHKEYNEKVYQTIRANGGWSNWSMIEIEKFPCKDSNEARARERYFYEELEATLNVRCPMRTKEDLKEWQKKYYEEHREEKREYMKKYTEEHAEERQEYMKKYEEEHREEKNRKARERYAKKRAESQ
jgi:hypothetical protein